MKIGVLTLPFNNNYGGYLQAIALMETLRRLGHQPVIIYRRNNTASFLKRIKFFALGIRGVFNNKKKHPFWVDSEKVFRYRGKEMIPFAKKYLKDITPPIYSEEKLRGLAEEYDAFIVGSDQVWRPIYVPGIEDYFFQFLGASDKKRIAYAASFGNTSPEYTEDQIAICGELLKQFTAVSLREESGKEVFSKFNWNYSEAKVVLDPTLLINKEFYMTMLDNTSGVSKGKLFCYILDSNMDTEEIEKRIVENQRLTSSYILNKANWESRNYVMPSIQSWLDGFYTSEYVLTDSYHGTVFAIIFNKPFVVYANKRRGIDRFKSLLGFFHLEDKLVTDPSMIDQALLVPIDWQEVNRRLLDGREQSISFLKSSLA